MILHHGYKEPSLILIGILKIILLACHYIILRIQHKILRTRHRIVRLWSVWRSCRRTGRIKMILGYIARHYLLSKIIVRSKRNQKDRRNCSIERPRVCNSSLKLNRIHLQDITIKRKKKQVLWIWACHLSSSWSPHIKKRLPKQSMEVEY
jgi:hypothetical protein